MLVAFRTAASLFENQRQRIHCPVHRNKNHHVRVEALNACTHARKLWALIFSLSFSFLINIVRFELASRYGYSRDWGHSSMSGPVLRGCFSRPSRITQMDLRLSPLNKRVSSTANGIHRLWHDSDLHSTGHFSSFPTRGLHSPLSKLRDRLCGQISR